MDVPFAIDPAGSDIPGEGARLRAAGPATPVTLPGGVTAWAVSHHSLIKRLLTDDRVSKDPRAHWPTWQRGEVTPDSWLHTWLGVVNMFTAYGEDHRRLRKLVAPAFTARRTEELAGDIEKVAGRLLDSMAAEPAGRTVDLRARYAHPLPMQVMCRLFGIPEGLRPRTAAVIARIFDTDIGPEEAASTWQEIQEVLSELVALKRPDPGDDMTSVLIAARDEDGTRLSEEELLHTLWLVISAGFETTVNLIGNAVHALLSHPEQLRLVTTGQASWSDVVEETLRWAPSVASLPLRFAVDDIPLPDGRTIARGEAILPAYAAAGRDPDQHGEDADGFDITRPAHGHLAFGHGVHMCLGAPLARLEARIALPALFERFPGLSLAGEPRDLVPLESFISNGFRALPVTL
ncbi:cytochrome P450 [Streptomyces sp. NPDC052179]|uniref:cytochrome P450 family protein n=1 Tax=Streptomyces sp. NPDC052179 TaxID=3155680 RepID=UPI0034358444